MKRSTFVDPDVTREAERFATLVADVTESSARNDALLAKFAVVGVPTIIFYGPGGQELDRLVGFVDADTFARTMRRVGGGSEEPARDAPSLTGLGEERRDVVGADGRVATADHVGAERVDVEAMVREQGADQVVPAGRHE